MRVLKEMEDKFKKWIDEKVKEKVNQIMAFRLVLEKWSTTTRTSSD